MSLVRHFRELDVYQNAMNLNRYEKVLGQIVRMADQADKWLIKPRGGQHG